MERKTYTGNQPNLVRFFYMLARDQVPMGALDSIMRKVSQPGMEETSNLSFPNPLLLDYVTGLVNKLVNTSNNENAVASIKRGLEQSSRGETNSLGSFAKFADDNNTTNPVTKKNPRTISADFQEFIDWVDLICTDLETANVPPTLEAIIKAGGLEDTNGQRKRIGRAARLTGREQREKLVNGQVKILLSQIGHSKIN